MAETAFTCLPIKNSGFLPDIKLSNRSPSAFLQICFSLPGKIITGFLLRFFICETTELRLFF
jgi:hypothetical protein